MINGFNFGDPTLGKFRHETEVFILLILDTDFLADIRSVSPHRSFYKCPSPPFNSPPFMSSLAAYSQLCFTNSMQPNTENTTVSIVLQHTTWFTGKGYLLASALNSTAQLRTSFKSQLTFYLHYFLLSTLPKEILDLTTS